MTARTFFSVPSATSVLKKTLYRIEAEPRESVHSWGRNRLRPYWATNKRA